MPEKTGDLSGVQRLRADLISVTCVCAVCGAILDVRPAFHLWPSTYAVSICWKCLEVEREKAFKDGYEKGYDEGYDDWVDDLVSEAE